jgi:DtxR family Mn-dependent transcriptional regulator
MAMSKSLEDYLEAIHRQVQVSGGARVVDIAHVLGVKMPSVNNAVRELATLGLIEYTPYQQIHLTPEGGRRAAEIFHRHTTLKAFLLSIGVSERNAESDACAMEHVLSAETLQRLAAATLRMPPLPAPGDPT